jgi:transcription termination/antitermination protein NusG
MTSEAPFDPGTHLGPKKRSYIRSENLWGHIEMSASHNQAAWYAVSTKSRREKVVASMLEYLDVANFLPLVNQERRWSDRKQMVAIPLFQGYVFVLITASGELQLRVLKVPGVVDFVRSNSGPLAIPDREIQDVRAVLSHGVGCSPHPFLKAGDRVRVVRGPLAGIEGTLIRSGSQSKLIISVEMIQRAVAVSIYETEVEPAYHRSTREPQSLSSYLPASDTHNNAIGPG